MKNAMMIQYSSISHLNGGFRISEILKNNGYDIHYFVDNKMSDYAQKNSYKYFTSFSTPLVEQYDEAAMKKDKFIYTYFDRLRDAVLQVFVESRKYELLEAIENISPEIIICDTFAGADFALIYPLIKQKNIRFYYLETMLSSTENKNVPYLNGKSFPDDKAGIFIEHIYRKWSLKLKRFWRGLFYLKYDNYSTVERTIQNQLMPKEYKINQENYFDLSFIGLPSFITSPIELEYFNTPKSTKDYYLGLFEKSKVKQVFNNTDERLEKLLNSNKTIIYISFGSVHTDRKSEEILSLIKKLNKVLEGMDDTIAILSLGKAKWSISDIQSFNNINIFEFVPQTYVLKYCSLFITHGGLNSFKESILECVPMLVFPLIVDQIGNARKIEYMKFGLMGNVKNEKEKDLKDKINIILNNDIFINSINNFNESINDKYDIDTALIPIIENEGVIK